MLCLDITKHMTSCVLVAMNCALTFCCLDAFNMSAAMPAVRRCLRQSALKKQNIYRDWWANRKQEERQQRSADGFSCKHHVPHASKMGRDAAPLRKGNVGNGPSDMGSALPPVVPPPSHCHKQSAAPLYGNSTYENSAGAGNLDHEQFARCEGHPLRKPAVHDGVSQPKKTTCNTCA